MRLKLLFQLLIVSILSSMVFAQEWTPDTRVTSTSSQTQDIAAVSDGRNLVHAVATERSSLQDVFYFQMNNLGALVDARQVSMTTGDARQPAVAVDSSGNKHFVWADAQDVNGQYRVLYSKLDANGNFVIERRVISDAAIVDSPQIVVDRQNDAHIVWSDFRDGNWEIYYEKIGADGTTLINDRRLTNALGTSFNPRIFYDSTAFQQQIHVAFEDNRDFDAEIYYMRLDIAGNVINEARVTNARGRSLMPSIAGDNGNAYIVYADYRVGNYPELYISKVDSRNIVTERQVTSDLGWTLQPSITMAPHDDEVYLVWQGHQHGNPEVYYSKRDTNNLEGANFRLTNQQAHSAGPVIVAEQNALRVLWQDNRDGNWEIYYKRNVNPSQAQSGTKLEGNVEIGKTVRLHINGPAHSTYVSALSRSLGQSFGLAVDDIFIYSVNEPAAVGFGSDSRGNFDDEGKATVTLNVPDRRGLIGQTFYFNYAVYERGRLQTLTEPYALTARA